MARVQTGCPDCKRCTNSAMGEGARKAGRLTAGLMTGGLSEVGMAFTRNCRGCGHAMSLHDRPDNNALKRDPDHRGTPVVSGHAAPYPAAPAPAAPAWGAPAPAPAPAAQSSQEIMDLLRQLGELRDAGIVTPEEFEAKKADLLRRL
ncbi:SHOCT domain-containing protein [Streptomyces sp. PSKA54]|uniref:SHOCT domain-containing protein n=1 Tax=Streptomyces himalayensis subsp. aureolus TaxID=2758039 RepID=A0A7W2HFB2_9ACTN|nr:SHOCT domain-containing protein [Streptomyces himalayensis subsp. aureolus]